MDDYKKVISLLKDSNFFYTISIDMSGTYSYISPNYDENFRATMDTLIYKPFYSTLHQDDIKICEEAGSLCFEHPDQLFPATLRKHDGDGGFVITQWELKAILDENNAPAGIFGVGYNITEYIDTRNKLMNAKFEIDLKNEKLSEIGFMQSHVARKPLANIMGLVSILNNTHLSANAKNLTAMIIESAKELDEVIKLMSAKTN